MTPVMAAGLTGKLMEMADVARLIDDAERPAIVQKRVAARQRGANRAEISPGTIIED
jgi:hypothetical protein